MQCPKCESENLVAKAQLIYLNDLEFPIVKGKIKRIKKSRLKDMYLEEKRYFIECKDCGYETENLLTDTASGFEAEVENEIMGGIHKFIEERRKKRKVDYEKRYRNYLATNPTNEELSVYIKKIKSIENMRLFQKVFEERYK